ncbi:MAG: inorganic phosphate transporter, partial [Alphaproteobacteria bacterium]|nr:inorganic phosphate transporter [Alphaproteobacteria bacterium]
FYCPILAALFAMITFYATRFLLRHVKIPVLYRDMWVRLLLIVSGVYSSYFLGANNIPAIAGPYLALDTIYPAVVVLLIGIAIALGAWMADRKVIETVSYRLFPLSPVEALVVVLSCGWTLYCFSGEGLYGLLESVHLPRFPLVPIPTSGVLVGSIIGVGLVKGHSGIEWNSLIKIIISWVFVPVASGLICWLILTMLTKGGAIL